MLKEAIYPSLLCAAAREGDIDKLKELQLNASAFLNIIHSFLLLPQK